MRRQGTYQRIVAAGIVGLLSAGCGQPQPATGVRRADGLHAAGLAPRQLAVRLRGDRLPALLRQGRAGGTRVLRRIPRIGWLVVELGATDARDALLADPAVAEAHELGPVEPEGAPDDPRLGEQYQLAVGRALEAWALGTGAGVKLAIVDTGVDLGHPDLAAKLDPASWNVFDRSNRPHDHYGHGTHTAGIAVAIAGNREGGAGVAPDAGLLVVKVLANGDEKGTDATVAEGVVYAADHGAKVISLSLGFYRRSPVLEAALDYALGRDVVIVASAGNNGEQNDPVAAPHLPSTHPGVIEVAATDALDRKAKFSNWGKTVSVAAPGVDVLSTLPTYEDAWTIERGYGRLSGTSMAAPFVAGVAALVRARFPALGAPAVKARIEATADDLGPPGFDMHFGHGRINAARALGAGPAQKAPRSPNE